LTKRVLRFAPSPTGYLHVGNIRTALFNYLQAKKVGAEFILRLDDTDKERSSQHFIDQIKRDLEWLGINWDRVEQQSLRIERYREVLNKLKDLKGKQFNSFVDFLYDYALIAEGGSPKDPAKYLRQLDKYLS